MRFIFPSVHWLFLPVDWFLDRCRTAKNVMGDMNVSCLLDGKPKLGRERSGAKRVGRWMISPEIIPILTMLPYTRYSLDACTGVRELRK